MTEETKAGLKLLAEYMELEKLPKYLQWISSTGYFLDLKYNKSWDWLIPVYAKVSNIVFDDMVIVRKLESISLKFEYAAMNNNPPSRI